jgi:hypothetical protein
MKISEFKNILKSIKSLNFYLENGDLVPPYFHVTEVGQVSKTFIDCGGVIRDDNFISMQLWHANDFDHRLSPQGVLDIIELSENKLNLSDSHVEIEYQSDTIGRYDLFYNGASFVLINKKTECLDEEKCGIPSQVDDSIMDPESPSNCAPGSGCC